MPRIIHDGAAQLGELFRDLSDEVGPDALYALLRRYFDDAREGRESEGPPADDLVAGLEAWGGELERALFGPVGDLGEQQTWPIVLVNDFRTRVAAEVRARTGTLPGQAPPPRRRIFVSHRQADHAEAQGLARAILLHGRFDVWLDVWDPLLRLVGRIALDPARQALLTALIIEMGLMNAQAVLALMTPNSSGSDWIPYEYGRVKKGGPFAESAAAALAPALAQARLPEYMRLGPLVPWDEVRLNPAALYIWLDRL